MKNAISQNIYLHGMRTLPAFGPTRLMRIIRSFPNFESAFRAPVGELVESGVELEIAEQFVRHRKKLDLEKELERMGVEGITLISCLDDKYPSLLKEIANPPPLLYCRGNMENPEEICIAIVGTRKITNYGRVVTPQLVEPLAKRGATIVSGLAFGVDALAQETAHKNGCRTIAILGGGLDEKTFYPKEHVWLADQILAQSGALLSEHPMGTPPLKHHFIARNRIISGMSVATVVIECNIKSGSLITARFALEQDRQVFAIPGPIYSDQSKGPNSLIRQGARPATSAHDILEELNLQTYPEEIVAQKVFGDSPLETALLQLIHYEPLHINAIIKQSGEKAELVTSALTMMELKGMVRNLGGQQYVLSR